MDALPVRFCRRCGKAVAINEYEAFGGLHQDCWRPPPTRPRPRTYRVSDHRSQGQRLKARDRADGDDSGSPHNDEECEE